MKAYTSFSDVDMRAFEPAMKIGLLATVNGAGLPHITLISTLQASTPTQVIWGQFTEGLSKQFVREYPRTGFLIMTLDKALWRGIADFTHTGRQGKEFDMYNSLPMFRYNAYFGVHTVYYMDLVAHYGGEELPMGQVVRAALETAFARTCSGVFSPGGERERVLNPWTQGLMNRLSNLKFLSYVRLDGYPAIVPVVQAQALDSARVVFSPSAYRDELEAIPEGTAVAIFGLSLDMEDVLMRGVFQGMRRVGGVRCGVVGVNWVYNSMPPKPQQIYPEVGVEPVTASWRS